jgi:hypothetical protein
MRYGALVLGLMAAPFLVAGGASAQGVQGVYANSNVEVYGGFTYFRFYEAPHLATNMEGFNFSVAYYPRQWVALDGEVVGAFGSQSGTNTQYFIGVAGPRLRWSSPRGIDVWGHVLGGGTHFSPQTPYGNQEAFAFELGGGIDLTPPHRRFAYRVSADMVGTTYFSTYQLSPKVSAGIVFKF